MRRGDVYTAAARGTYTGKPRPVVIVQDDRFDATGSVTVCPLTTETRWIGVEWTDPRHGRSWAVLRTDVFPRQER